MRNLNTTLIVDEGATLRAKAAYDSLPTLTIGEPFAPGSHVLFDSVTLMFHDKFAFSKLQRIADAINHILAEPEAAPLSVAAE